MTKEEYQKAISHWTEKDKTAVKADRETLLHSAETILKERKNGVLGTAFENQPRCTPVDYAYFDGAIYILSEGGLKYQGLEQNKQVSFAVYFPDGTFGNLKSVQINGIAEMVSPDSEEYRKNAEVRGYSCSALQNLHMHLIKIIPKEMTILDSELKNQKFDSRGIVVF